MLFIFSLNIYALGIIPCYAIFKRIILMATENVIECIPEDSLNHMFIIGYLNCFQTFQY